MNWYTNFCNGVVVDNAGVAMLFVQTGVQQKDGHTAYDLLDDGDSIVSVDDVEHAHTINKLHESLKLDEARDRGFTSIQEAESWMKDMNHWFILSASVDRSGSPMGQTDSTAGPRTVLVPALRHSVTGVSESLYYYTTGDPK